ncbi:hypothetical protein Q5P01_004004 [Channa striata]|uniref:Prolactin releasing hormone 2 n=1 Tax=Channa striata TaxID=64152 RepID=A0AA88NGX8_CHASR|nr:hypothetical protein Q5P01_004004 [Channa striata]
MDIKAGAHLLNNNDFRPLPTGFSLQPKSRCLERLLTSCCPGERLIFSSAHSTTVEHDFHIVHNVDNRSPEIDPFWYVGRGVRPIGRFGKRHSSVEALGSGGMQPVVRMVELLLNSLRNKENLGKVLDEEDRDWLP